MDIVKEKVGKIREEGEAIRREVRDKTLGYILSALGLVAGLAWNDAIKGVIEYVFPLKETGIWAKLLYAVIITAIIVVASVYLLRLSRKEENK